MQKEREREGEREGEKHRDSNESRARTIHNINMKQKPYLAYLPFWLCAGFSSIHFIISLAMSVVLLLLLLLLFFWFIRNGKTISVFCFGAMHTFFSSFFQMCIKSSHFIPFHMRMLLSSLFVQFWYYAAVAVVVVAVFPVRLHMLIWTSDVVRFIYFSIACASDLRCCFSWTSVRDSAMCRLFPLCSFNTLVC